jgi:hypothetical protein
MAKEIRTSLNEVSFTHLCKSGVISHGTGYTKTDVYFTKVDMKNLASGEIVTKHENGQTFQYLLQDIGFELIKEIIRRSPIYGEMYYEL